MSHRVSARFCFWEAIFYSVMLVVSITFGSWLLIISGPMPWVQLVFIGVMWLLVPTGPIAFFAFLSWGAYGLAKKEER